MARQEKRGGAGFMAALAEAQGRPPEGGVATLEAPPVQDQQAATQPPAAPAVQEDEIVRDLTEPAAPAEPWFRCCQGILPSIDIQAPNEGAAGMEYKRRMRVTNNREVKVKRIG